MKSKMSILGALALAGAFGLGSMAQAKLPPLSPEAKVKADEAKAKAAWSDKVAAYQLCKAQDRAVASYMKTAKAAGKDVKPAVETAACGEPGPYVPPSPPIEAAGAHSPAATAASPPSTQQTAAQQAGTAPASPKK